MLKLSKSRGVFNWICLIGSPIMLYWMFLGLKEGQISARTLIFTQNNDPLMFWLTVCFGLTGSVLGLYLFLTHEVKHR